MATKEKEVAEKGTSLATTGGAALPDFLKDTSDVAGLGNSKDSRDSVVPFLSILQKGSPQVNKREPEYIEGAEQGMLFNTATTELWDGEQGVEVIPCGYSKHFVEWKPNRAGYANTHPFDIPYAKNVLRAKKTTAIVEGKERTFIMLPNNNILTETAYTYVLVNGSPMVIGASSTALGPMRQWMSYRKAQRKPNREELPAFSKRYLLTTVYQKNDAGDWFNWKFRDVGFVLSQQDYEEAKTFAIAIVKGEVQIGRPDEFGESGDGGSDEDDGIPV